MAEDSEQPKEWVARAAPAPQDIGAALAALSGDDLLRLCAIARLRARSLPAGISWSDLLHEAVARALAGTRQWPPGVPLLAFLAGVMHSLCDEQWRRRRLQDTPPAPEGAGPVDDAERGYAAAEALAAIDRLFASDAPARGDYRLAGWHDSGRNPPSLWPQHRGVRHGASQDRHVRWGI
jgi:DNA-directed RNA polymerase specialized sigma24 family protein